MQTLQTFFACLFLTALCGCGGGSSSSSVSQYRRETIVDNALFPVSLAPAIDGRLFYTELVTGAVRVVVNGSLLVKPVVVVDTVGKDNEGLLGIALDPNFSSNGFLYVYYTAKNPERNRVLRFSIVDNQAVASFVVLDNLPFGGHNGGRLVFDQNGKLFVSVGDAGNPALAQDLNSFGGKVLRINTDGTIPSDNPDPNSLIFASGFRNPFGLAVDSRTGALFASDNGPSCDDELNIVRPGTNLGWRSGQPCGDTDPHFVSPLITFNPTIAPTGIAFSREHDLLMADFLAGHLTRFQIDPAGVIGGEDSLVSGELGPLIDVAAGIDGVIYVASQNSIARLVPEE